MGLVATITPQETFPITDISKENAGWLELVLANRGTLEIVHVNSEATRICRLGHAVISRVGGTLESVRGDTADALNLGIMTYEAVSACVNPRPTERDLDAIKNGVSEIAQAGRSEDTLCGFINEADTAFRGDYPNTLSVVSEVARRFYPNSAAPDYAVYGAALACQLERSVISASEL